MFQTPNDIATHEQPWATILRIGLREAAARICGHLAIPEDHYDFEAPVFRRLTAAQQVAMLAIVGKAMLDPSAPAPELTAVVDATAMTIVDMFRVSLIVEADEDGCRDVADDPEAPSITECRTAFLKLIEPTWDPRKCGLLPDVNSVNWKVWDELSGVLYDYVLYDEDCNDEAAYVDLTPQDSKKLKRRMGIDPGYYSTPAPEPTRQQVTACVAKLEALTGVGLDATLVAD